MIVTLRKARLQKGGLGEWPDNEAIAQLVRRLFLYIRQDVSCAVY